ncbi:Nif3-like dinuclear metal center hexameric protein [Butyricimonas virosa]|uniref:Nif3-like dinuclear metal center hexameric protein n=1 Tax=Butyricimonas virosa TaxID=544645 RepID=UPI0022E63B43|nr:Nif3-like dinuclear metal center hexameric protein [Butyricimonas virosa]MBR5461479.1 Nif3-like dinuclear metal center hexameric protein [Butyricimonas sp.]
MYIKEIISLIEDYAPLKFQASFDNSGLLCGNPERELTSILLCIDVTEEVIKEAIDKGHNLIISHHPLIFSGLKHITPATYVERCVIDAIKHDITIYAAHTNMDVVSNGVSGRMADKLDLYHRQILQPEGDPMDGNGFGIIGELQQPVESMAFLQQVKEIFRCDRLRYTTPHTPFIQRVAVCGGAGASFFKQALAGQSDIYISGDFKYHDFFLTENRIMIADIGHYESEQFTKEIFYEILTKKISKFAVQFSEINTNPIKYL